MATTEDAYEKYHTQMALVNSDQELKAIFNQAVAEGWTEARFTAAFQNTKWYTEHGISWRGAATAKSTDPGQWQVALDSAKRQIEALSLKMGFSLQPQDVDKLAEQTLYTSWGRGIDESLLRSHIFEMGKITGTGGEAVATISELKKIAYANGQSYTDSWYDSAVAGVVAQGKDLSYYQEFVKKDALSQYGAFADQINAGMSVRDAAGGYISKMAQVLDMNDTDIKLNDPLLARALQGSTANGQQAAMPLYEFEKSLKMDDRYFKTNAAKQDMQGLASEIARQFGKAV